MISQIEDTDALVSPVMAKGKKAPMKMKTPGMGEMLGAPKYRGSPNAGKIEPGALPYELPKMAKGGSVSSPSKRADGCCVKGKTKGKML